MNGESLEHKKHIKRNLKNLKKVLDKWNEM